MSLIIKVDEAKFREVEAELAALPNALNMAIAGAINKILPKMRTRLVRSVASVVNLRQAFIKRRMSIKKATQTTLAGRLTIYDKKIDLIQFGATQDRKTFALKFGGKSARQKGGGVSVLIYKNQGRVVFPHAFLNVGTRTGRLAVFKRDGVGDTLVPRYPIFTRYGPSMHEIIAANPKIVPAEMEVTRDEINTQLDSQVDRLLNRRKADR